MIGLTGGKIIRLAWSASLAAVTLNGVAMADDHGALIDEGAEWEYYTGVAELPEGWLSDPFRYLTTGEGPSPLGFSYDDIATVIPYGEAADNKYPVAYFARAFDWSGDVKSTGHAVLTLGVSCDDGCIAYVNGLEIGRVRLPEGRPAPFSAEPVGQDTSFQTFDVAPSLLKPGRNIVAVELHQQHPRSSDFRFNAVLSAAASD